MAYLSDQDEAKIKSDLKKIINSKLLDGYKNRKHQVVLSVTSIQVDFEIDKKESDRDNIIVLPVHAIADTWVEVGHNIGSSTKYGFSLLINDPVKFSYDQDSREYEIIGEDKIAVINMTND
jgi:hypothetical protein